MHESVDELEAEICKFLNIASIDEAPAALVASFRQSVCRAPHNPSQLAWVKRAENIARQQKVKPFDHANIKEALSYLLKLSLWFTLMHEMGHLVEQHEGILFNKMV